MAPLTVRRPGRSPGGWKWPATLLSVVVVVLTVAVPLGACSRSADQLDRQATERVVGTAIGTKVEPEVTRTVCPQDLPRGKGEHVVCQVKLNGVTRSLQVEVRQQRGAGDLTIRPLEAVVDPAVIEVQLRKDLVRRFRRAFLVDCGEPGHLVVAVGHTFRCAAGDRDGKKAVDATVTDTSGTMRFQIR